LWPKHKLIVLRSRDRCQRVADLIAKSISQEKYSRRENYEFLTAIVREHGLAVQEETLRTILGLQPPKPGWADSGYEAEQRADDRARERAHQALIETADAELGRRRRP
jgi:hypothetical protein